jgi:nicotinate-nucleotide pyrophosphorylase (carboxylating)
MHSTKDLIEIALKEDVGSGDITTDNLVDQNLEGTGLFTAKEPFVIAGLDIVRQVFEYLDPNVISRFLNILIRMLSLNLGIRMVMP